MTHGVFDNEHRLTNDKVKKRLEGKITIEYALFLSIKGFLISTYNLVNKLIFQREIIDGSVSPGYEKIDLTSTHGFSVENQENGKIDDKLSSSVDDEDEIVFNALDNKEVRGIDDGKVTYSILSNTPTGHMDLERPLERAPFFKVVLILSIYKSYSQTTEHLTIKRILHELNRRN
jgi:hypothetical protein